ncbi:polyprenol phosphomannose-dependent alpha 1,6 mannosyltransferase MptB [Rhodococcus sp. (in: high G+C Gram-positive bacteria)]|uniref:polyprenol phosphomannose-dependent alpha 1,6 mannosyltransferase MptB n=1 Tax=Rhodococcus sp. TaxID=1831 RepID=UPI001A20D332|nr:polyprenol phosphomannose-dependent alpha 1,6 mannosyltransferase MptB [Rhodococcus sp. (in: high G+C Gram-positive bacteria)]MBJ7480689.1 polyprenol phosphomannose-dependent alpha 1,6 mannosyltransferase MptB [Rhodococcus sp. (in: high G+C Gram-positive bacteria)]
MPQTPEKTTTARSARAILLEKPKALALSTIGVRPFGSAPRQSMAAVLHGDEDERPGLNAKETAQLRGIRRFGATGAVLMAVGALGAGAQPVLQNPTAGLRVLSLPGRMPTVSLTMTMTGTVLVVLAWLMMGRFAVGDIRSRSGAPRRMTRSQLDRTLLLWILPLSVAPPMFSRDVYSYLAQSEIAARGLDPYAIGPKAALGVDHVLTRTVPTIWRDTPAPYGPFFLWLGRGISSLTGDNIVAGIFLHRLLALAGVALIVWAIPRLAKRCGVSAVSSLWLGAANPLLLFHLVAGIHNEALMLGLMLAGIEIALRAVEGSEPIRGQALFYLVAGSGLIALSSTVKIPSLLALGFVGMALARRWGGTWKALAGAAILLGIVAAVVTFVISVASGLGMGWINTLGTATAVRSWMSIPTLLGVGTGLAGVLLGLGDHTTAILTITRPIAYLVAMLITARMMISVYMGRIHPVGGLGIALGAIVLLFPVVQPWYLLWAILPLAAWATAPIFRIPAVVFTSIVSVMLMSNGAEYLPFMIVQAVIATILTVGTLIVFTRNSLPWRSDKPVAEITKGGPVDEGNSAGAYADSP